MLLQAKGGCRMSPNMIRILYQWGLRDKIRQVSVRSKGTSLMLCKLSPSLLFCTKGLMMSDNAVESGEYLGKYRWQDEVTRELQADFAFVQVSSVPGLPNIS